MFIPRSIILRSTRKTKRIAKLIYRPMQYGSEQKQVLTRLKGPFDVVPQLAYSKTIAKSDKKPSRHFIRSEAFVNEKVIYRKRIKQPS